LDLKIGFQVLDLLTKISLLIKKIPRKSDSKIFRIFLKGSSGECGVVKISRGERMLNFISLKMFNFTD